MSEPAYLQHMGITPNILKSIHIQAVGEYLEQRNDVDHLMALMEGETALLIRGDLEVAVDRLQAVYDSIPVSDDVVSEHAHLTLIAAKRCQRYASSTR